MPIPGSVLNGGLNFDPTQLGAVFYPSIATFYAPTAVDEADGQVTHSFNVIDQGHSNLSCRLSPLILLRPSNQEAVVMSAKMKEAKFQVNLPVYIADASDTWQVQVDGVRYEIKAVEYDGNKLTTRLAVGDITPFNS